MTLTMKNGSLLSPCEQRWPINEDEDLRKKFEETHLEESYFGNGSRCCHFFGDILGSKLKGIMTIMKHSTLNGQTFESDIELEKDFGDIKTILEFPSKPLKIEVPWYTRKYEGNDRDSDKLRGMRNLAMIPLCKVFKGPEVEEDSYCHEFTPMLTAKGLCYSFNAPSIKNLFRSSDYMETFYAVMNQENHTQDPTMIKGALEDFGFRFVLNGHYFNDPSSTKDSQQYAYNELHDIVRSRSIQKPYFFIGISQPSNAPAMDTFERVSPGQRLKILVIY